MQYDAFQIAIEPRRKRERRLSPFIGKPKSPEISQAEHKKWHGRAPTKIEREKLQWRPTDIKF